MRSSWEASARNRRRRRSAACWSEKERSIVPSIRFKACPSRPTSVALVLPLDPAGEIPGGDRPGGRLDVAEGAHPDPDDQVAEPGQGGEHRRGDEDLDEQQPVQGPVERGERLGDEDDPGEGVQAERVHLHGAGIDPVGAGRPVLARPDVEQRTGAQVGDGPLREVDVEGRTGSRTRTSRRPR